MNSGEPCIDGGHAKDLFCIPTAKKAVPAGPDWIHEVKYDGYRLRVERNGDRIRLLSKSGLDWTKRYPWIVETARKIRKSRFILQGKIGPDLFDAACRMGLEGIVSKHRERPYRAGRCDHWQKVKNPKHPAFSRVVDQF